MAQQGDLFLSQCLADRQLLVLMLLGHKLTWQVTNESGPLKPASKGHCISNTTPSHT